MFNFWTTTCNATSPDTTPNPIRTTTITVRVNDIINHKKFLIAANQGLPSRGKNISKESLFRYSKCWLPLVARHDDKTPLIPPLDVAWIWHVHRLAPLLYVEYCQKNFGKVLNAPTPFLAQNMEHLTSAEQDNVEHTQRLWQQYNPDVPICFNPQLYDTSSTMPFDSKDQDFVLGNYNLAEACSRQQKFLTSVSTPLFTSTEFLAHAIKQYCQFLLLCTKGGVMVPSVPIDLVWHTHQLLSSTTYIAETRSVLGFALNHNDNLEEEKEKEKEEAVMNELEEPFLVAKSSTLHNQWLETKKEWGEMFDERMSSALVPICIDNFISSKNSEIILSQLSTAADAGHGLDSTQDHVFKTSALVPRSWKEVMRQAMFSEKGHAEQDFSLAALDSSSLCSSDTEPLPVVIKKGSTETHQDRLGGNKDNTPLDAFVSILYLKGSGTMRFVHVEDESKNYNIKIQPFSLLFFPNKHYTHEFIATDEEETRVMLGPFSFMGEDVVRVGDCGGDCGGDSDSGSNCGSNRRDSSSRRQVTPGTEDTGQLMCMCLLVPCFGIGVSVSNFYQTTLYILSVGRLFCFSFFFFSSLDLSCIFSMNLSFQFTLYRFYCVATIGLFKNLIKTSRNSKQL